MGNAMLMVSVPQEARIFVNGAATRSEGSKRQYVSRNLSPGYAYTYEVRAEMDVDGQLVQQTKTVKVKAGQQHDLVFNFDVAPAPETVLTLHVPEDARVFLAGNEARGTGEVRTFRTTKLADGQSWNDYTVRVLVNRDGTELSKEERITLNAGDSRELKINFDEDQLAIAR